uniref:Uncharacterized protein n=1 Tax=Rhizophora mucronata TaxID=61149 RepID=A0A2P2J2G5_RHIMU
MNMCNNMHHKESNKWKRIPINANSVA